MIRTFFTSSQMMVLFILFPFLVTISFSSDLRSPVCVYTDISQPSSQEIETKFYFMRSPKRLRVHTNISHEEIEIKSSKALNQHIRPIFDQSNSIIVSNTQNRIIYPTPNVAKYFIFSFLKPKELEKIYNYLHFLDPTFSFQKMFSGEKRFKCHPFVQPNEEVKILYHFLNTNDHIVFCEKTKIATALDKNFHGSNETILTLIYEDISPFHSFHQINNHESVHFAISSKNKFIILLKNNLRAKQFSLLCSGQKCVPSIENEKNFIILFHENSEIQFPEDISYILRAKKFKFQKLFQIFCLNGKLISKYQEFWYKPIRKLGKFLNRSCLGELVFEIFLFIFGYLILFLIGLPFYVQSFPILYAYFFLLETNENFFNFFLSNLNLINLQPVVPIFATFYYLFVELIYPFNSLPPKEELKIVTMILFFKRNDLCFKTFLIFIISYIVMLIFHFITYVYSLLLPLEIQKTLL